VEKQDGETHHAIRHTYKRRWNLYPCDCCHGK